ncbi:hypothetical protein IC582_019951 [Cucumis melo]
MKMSQNREAGEYKKKKKRSVVVWLYCCFDLALIETNCEINDRRRPLLDLWGKERVFSFFC